MDDVNVTEAPGKVPRGADFERAGATPPTDAVAVIDATAERWPRGGDIVEFCLNAGIHPGEWRPAVVIKGVSADCAQLAVLTDFADDGLPCPLWAPAATRGDAPGQWRWSEP